MPRVLPQPHTNNLTNDGKRRGACPECGKSVSLRNTDGMIRNHFNVGTRELCEGAYMAPSKAAESVLIVGWVPPRRSN